MVFRRKVYVVYSLDEELSSCFMDSSFRNDEVLRVQNFDVLTRISVVFVF